MKELPLAPVQLAQAAIKSVVNQTPAADAQDSDALSARIGKAMHRLLEWGNTSASNAQACAREFMLSPAQGAQAAAMAERILQGEGAWAWNPALLVWQGNEVELMYQGQLLRLDRLVQRKGVDNAGPWWVLDYKSAESPQSQPALMEKMRDYQAAVQALYPDDIVKCAFLTAQGALIEVMNR